ncbi:SH3 domain-containing protein [uncultured Lutibacter sp.]|uniref:SH3 domain-containing protein n=1 Tax=uncultured Lutibacter sp. TaxID=437739 RepID=UPI00263164E0|nr:SH3 domain-containing protein [uncultured Lutibacter sp.]
MMKKNMIPLLSILIIVLIAISFNLYNQNKTLKRDYKRLERIFSDYESENINLKKDMKRMIENHSTDIKTLQFELQKRIDKENKRKDFEKKKNQQNLYKTLKDLKLRQNPNRTSTVILTIPKNSTVNVIADIFDSPIVKKEFGVDWWKIKYKDKYGWIVFDATIVDFNNDITGGESLLKIQ